VVLLDKNKKICYSNLSFGSLKIKEKLKKGGNVVFKLRKERFWYKFF
jgi:hypothetical protein